MIDHGFISRTWAALKRFSYRAGRLAVVMEWILVLGVAAGATWAAYQVGAGNVGAGAIGKYDGQPLSIPPCPLTRQSPWG